MIPDELFSYDFTTKGQVFFAIYVDFNNDNHFKLHNIVTESSCDIYVANLARSIPQTIRMIRLEAT